MDQNRLNVTLGSEITQALQPWPQETGAAKAFVLDHPVIGYAVALLACEVDQRHRLTGDRVLLLLLLGRYSGVDRGSLHRASPSRLIDANGTNPFWNQDPVDLLQLDGEKTVKRMLELDAAIMATAFSHCRRLRRETPAALGSPCR